MAGPADTTAPTPPEHLSASANSARTVTLTWLASSDVVWALSDTGSLGGVPSLSLRTTKVDVGSYSPPPPAEQKRYPNAAHLPEQQPVGHVLNGQPDPFTEKASTIDSNDSRMQHVIFVNGQLRGGPRYGRVGQLRQAGGRRVVPGGAVGPGRFGAARSPTRTTSPWATTSPTRPSGSPAAAKGGHGIHGRGQ